jgi:hypothetical protein
MYEATVVIGHVGILQIRLEVMDVEACVVISRRGNPEHDNAILDTLLGNAFGTNPRRKSSLTYSVPLS